MGNIADNTSTYKNDTGLGNMTIDSCPACGSQNINNYLDTELTTFFFPVSEEMIKKIKKEPFRLKICDSCSHIFQYKINKQLLELIYGQLYAYYNLDTSEEFQEVYRKRTIEFIRETIDPGENKKILDIGCGEGTYFPLFEQLGFSCYGIEPSKKGQIAREKNPNSQISTEYFEENDNLFNTTFDVILMNWVLEHIVDLDSFFKRIKQYLQLGTRLIIQVPDIMYNIKNNINLFYVHEHINYFTFETLQILLKRKGFKIIGYKYGENPALLICGEYTGQSMHEIAENAALVDIKKDFLKKTGKLKKKIKRMISENRRIIFYGMGLLSFWISDYCLSISEKAKIELVDDNKYYKGKYVPSFNKRLSDIGNGDNLDRAVILITTSPVYHAKIKKLIKSKFSGNYKIVTIKDNDIHIEK